MFDFEEMNILGNCCRHFQFTEYLKSEFYYSKIEYQRGDFDDHLKDENQTLESRMMLKI